MICKTCKKSEPDVSFRVGRSKCICCTAAYDAERVKSPEGLVRRIFNNQRMTTRKMGRPLPTYNYEELCLWLDNQPEFHTLYWAWVNSGHDKNLIPSIDRKDNNVSYTLDNIQVTTWRQNLLNQKKQNVSCEYIHTGSKAIEQFTLDGQFIQRFASLGAAARALNGSRASASNIGYAAHGKMETAYGFKWAWAALS